MPLYLDADTLKPAVERLRTSRAQSRLFDYLIFRRALVSAGGPPNPVVTGMSSKSFQDAINEWARIHDEGGTPHIFFNPFGTASASDNGFRTKKFLSNGPSDTVSGWGTSMAASPFVSVPGSSPRAFTFAAISGADLEKAFLKAPGADDTKKPRLSDTALWWLRSRDLEEIGFGVSSDLSDLVGTLRSEVGLTETEVSSLFDTSLV